jgi:hypothetical protein
MLRTSLRFFPPVNNHSSDGRTTSAPTTTSSELVINLSRFTENFPWWRSHCSGRCAQSSPAASAPLANHRCCQVLPGWSASQSSSSGSPQRRLSRTRSDGSTTAADATNWSTSPRSPRVAGQSTRPPGPDSDLATLIV